MDPSKSKTVSLGDLPDDMLMCIVSKVGSGSPVDYFNTVVTSKSLNFGCDTYFIAKDLSLAPFVKDPLRSRRYQKVMDNCLRANNADANYVKGVVEFFHHRNQFLGMHHFRLAYKSGHKEGSYIYGVLLMAIGQILKGKKVLNKLADAKGFKVIEDSWNNVQISLGRFTPNMRDVFVHSYVQMQPPPGCHPPEPSTSCYQCFHFYLMSEFFEMMMGLNQPLGSQQWV